MRISDWSSDVGSSDLWQQRRGQALCAAKDQGSSAVAPIGQDKSRAVTRHQRLAVERFDFAVGQHRLGLDRSEEHTSELQSLMRISYAVFCLKKKKKQYHE